MASVNLLTNGLGDVNQGGSLVPPGTIFAFAGTSAPAGWLICDGAEYSQTTYSKLFTAISTNYNTQINPTTGGAWAAPAGGNFRVPDYRGIFLRSTGQASGQSNIAIGAHQTDDFKSHAHSVSPNFQIMVNTSVAGNSWSVNSTNTTKQDALTQASIQNNGGTETRPINVSCNRIIKY